MARRLLVNVGGAKGWSKFPLEIRRRWVVLDQAGVEDGRYILHDLNSGQPLPLPDNSVQAFYTSHTLEHIHIDLLPQVFAELRRCLVTGGLLRIVVPDIEKGIAAYGARNMRVFSHGPTVPEYYPKTQLGILMAWWTSPDREHNASGHHSAFDWETLVWYLQGAGFLSYARKSYNDGHPAFVGLDFPRYKDFSIYAEAEK